MFAELVAFQAAAGAPAAERPFNWALLIANALPVLAVGLLAVIAILLAVLVFRKRKPPAQ